jgi:hypothetical protein
MHSSFSVADHVLLGTCSANGTNYFCETKTCAEHTKPFLVNWNSTSRDIMKDWSAEEIKHLNMTLSWRPEIDDPSNNGNYPFGQTAVLCTAQELDMNSTILLANVTPAAAGAVIHPYTLIKHQGFPCISSTAVCARQFCTCNGGDWRVETFMFSTHLWLVLTYVPGIIFVFLTLLFLIGMVTKELVITEMVPHDIRSVSYVCTQ